MNNEYGEVRTLGAATYQLITREIAPKQKAYIVVTSSPGVQEITALCEAEIPNFIALGATHIYLCCKDPVTHLPEGVFYAGSYLFTFDSNIDTMQLPSLKGIVSENRTGFSLVPLTEEEVGDYFDIYTAVFLDAPNSSSTSIEEVHTLLHDPNKKCGFICLDSIPVGTYELNMNTTPPTIVHFALVKSVQGTGLGAVSMKALLKLLENAGATGAQLTVSTRILPAIALYRKLGFLQGPTLSRWFRYDAKEVLHANEE